MVTIKKPTVPSPFRCFTGVAYAGALFVLIFGASMVEDGICMSARSLGVHCNHLPAWLYWTASLVGAALFGWSSYCWWRNFVVGTAEAEFLPKTSEPIESRQAAAQLRGMMGQPLDSEMATVQRLGQAKWLEEPDTVPIVVAWS